MNFCQYCGFACCKVDLYKTRPYPKNNLGYSKRGDICKVCDRKFFVKEMINESTITIEENQQKLLHVQKILAEKQQEVKLIEMDIDDQTKYQDIELDKVREVNSEIKEKLKNLRDETQKLNEEIDNQ
mmetsp:Transcript_15212/g.14786  ORF Transcript_15212/g.14786 Transcript_15212/m.14786 type:complete len:127 (+) Transcript_15212:377-757(+)